MEIYLLLINNSRKPMPNSINIVVEVNEYGEIIKDFKPFNISIDSTTLQDSVNIVIKNDEPSSKIDISGSTYSYLKQ